MQLLVQNFQQAQLYDLKKKKEQQNNNKKYSKLTDLLLPSKSLLLLCWRSLKPPYPVKVSAYMGEVYYLIKYFYSIIGVDTNF